MKQLAQAEPDDQRRSDYGGLALVFAELAGCWQPWKQGLEGWNVQQSQQVLEWQAEARREGEARGKAEGKAEALLQLLHMRFPGAVSAELEATIRSTTDLAQIDRWFSASVAAASMDDFLRRTRT